MHRDIAQDYGFLFGGSAGSFRSIITCQFVARLVFCGGGRTVRADIEESRVKALEAGQRLHRGL
jgi:hypothetical protein